MKTLQLALRLQQETFPVPSTSAASTATKVEPLAVRQQKRIDTTVNAAVQKKIKEKIVNEPLSGVLSDPSYSSIIRIFNDGAAHMLRAVELALTEVDNFLSVSFVYLLHLFRTGEQS